MKTIKDEVDKGWDVIVRYETAILKNGKDSNLRSRCGLRI